MSTIYGSQTVAITLAAAFQNVTLDADIVASGEDLLYMLPNSGFSLATTLFSAVYGPKTSEFTVDNDLEITSSIDPALGIDAGILLGTIGSVINSGEISAQNGLIILGEASGGTDAESSVENAGLISASSIGIYLRCIGSVTNFGTVRTGADAVFLDHGGYVSNTGTMSGGAGVYASSGASSNIYNKNGTYIFNSGTINATGLTGWGVYAAGPQAVISNAGRINTKFQGIVLDSYGALYNFGAVYNSGTINGGYFGIEASNGGYISNTGIVNSNLYSSGRQSAQAGHKPGTLSLPVGFGIAVGQGGTVVNSGTVDGLAAVYLQIGGGSIVNRGSIHGAGDGVFMRAPGTLSNQGTISAGTGVFSPGGLISNAGVISGYGNGYGVILDGGGTIANTGTIMGGLTGIFSYGGTVISSGVVGGEEMAIKFRQGAQVGNAGRLIIDPGAVFVGGVSGGGASLELAASGSESGNLTFGAGAAYGFVDVTIDSGATWTLAGDATLASVANYGTIVVAAGSDISIENESGGGHINTLQGSIAIFSNAALNLAASPTFLTPELTLTSTSSHPILTESPSYHTLKPNLFATSMSAPSISDPFSYATAISYVGTVITLQA